MNSMNTQSNTRELGLMVRDEKVVVSSRTVAEAFGKRHDHVLRDIKNLECTEEFRLPNFGESSYINEQQREMPEYLMTRDGFTFLAMGFTGPRAAVFKEAYIEAFNKMEAELKNRNNPYADKLPKTFAEALRAYADECERRLELEAKVIEDTPKVIFHDAITAVDKSGIMVKDMATILTQNGFRQSYKTLFEWLREHGYLCKNEGYKNKPIQEYVDKGYFVTRESTFFRGNTGEKEVGSTTLITPLGQKHILTEFIRLYSN